MKTKKLKRIRNLYIGNLYNCRWYECYKINSKKPADKYAIINIGITYLYKTRNGKFILANDMIKSPIGRIKLYLSNIVNYFDVIPTVKLSSIDPSPNDYDECQILGDFIDEDSLKKIK